MGAWFTGGMFLLANEDVGDLGAFVLIVLVGFFLLVGLAVWFGLASSVLAWGKRRRLLAEEDDVPHRPEPEEVVLGDDAAWQAFVGDPDAPLPDAPPPDDRR